MNRNSFSRSFTTSFVSHSQMTNTFSSNVFCHLFVDDKCLKPRPQPRYPYLAGKKTGVRKIGLDSVVCYRVDNG
jgi:hypothetical protein